MPPGRATLRPVAQSLAIATFCLKLLLFPTTPSTDFEVHRHWKALTHNLPLSQWYVDSSSQWTLDYPPLFAYFECALSHIAAVVHAPLLDLDAHGYDHPAAVAFLRATVLATDPLFSLAAFYYAETLFPGDTLAQARRAVVAFALTVLHPGIFLVDNVHFQYNALPLAFLLFTLAALLSNRPVVAAALFSTALNLKHTLLPAVPAVAVMLLRQARTPGTFVQVAVSTAVSFLLPWYPLYHVGGTNALTQALRRMFPFSRGLLHAYWAPNAWAVYAGMDKALTRAGLSVRNPDVDAASGIIGGKRPFAALPNPTPAVCAALVAGAIAPVLLGIRRGCDAPLAVGVSALVAFSFSWHVHEKAMLVALVVLAGLAVDAEENFAEGFLWASLGGTFGLFPLVTEVGVAVYKVAHFAGYHVLAGGLILGRRFRWKRHWGLVGYTAGLMVVEAYAGVGGVHRWVLGDRLAFLPLAIVSTYAAAGVGFGLCKVWWAAVGAARTGGKEGVR